MIGFLRGLRWLEPVVELLRLGMFAGLVAFGIAYLVAPPERRRRRALLVIGYVGIMSAAAGLSQIDAWPFANWALVHTMRGEEINSWEIEATDGTGRVWTVDPRVLQPLAPEEFGVWVLTHGLPSSVAGHLLGRAERGRQDFLGGAFPPNDRFIGAASAPFHFRQRRLWLSVTDVPQTPFVSISIVRLHWNIEERERLGGQAIQRASMPERLP